MDSSDVSAAFGQIKQFFERLIADDGRHRRESTTWLMRNLANIFDMMAILHGMGKTVSECANYERQRLSEENQLYLKTLAAPNVEYAVKLRATEPRDYLYGMLGLAYLEIVPDYEKPLREVFRDFIGALLRTYAVDVDLFFALGALGTAATGLRRNDFDLPFWAPEYANPEKLERLPNWVPNANRDPQGLYGDRDIYITEYSL